MIKVGLVEDHAMVRQGFKHVIEQNGRYQLTQLFDGYQSVINQIPNLDVDILLIDISLPDGNGLDIARQLNINNIEVKKVFVSMYEQYHYIASALELGALGYISKRAAAEELVNALDIVSQGGEFLSKEIQASLKGVAGVSSVEISKLTNREKEIFMLLAQGHVPKKVAQLTGTMPKTVLNQRAVIYEKLNATSQFDLLKIALREGVLQITDFV